MAVEQEEDTWVNIKAKDFYEMQATMHVLKRQIGALSKTVKVLQKRQFVSRESQVQPMRDITVEEAMGLVEDCMEKKGRAYPDDIATTLGISTRVVIEALDRLEKEGAVQKAK